MKEIIKGLIDKLKITGLVELNNAYFKKTGKGYFFYENDPEALSERLRISKLIAGILNEGGYSLLDSYAVIETDTVKSYGEDDVRNVINNYFKEDIAQEISNSIVSKDTEWIPSKTFTVMQLRVRLEFNV